MSFSDLEGMFTHLEHTLRPHALPPTPPASPTPPPSPAGGKSRALPKPAATPESISEWQNRALTAEARVARMGTQVKGILTRVKKEAAEARDRIAVLEEVGVRAAQGMCVLAAQRDAAVAKEDALKAKLRAVATQLLHARRDLKARDSGEPREVSARIEEVREEARTEIAAVKAGVKARGLAAGGGGGESEIRSLPPPEEAPGLEEVLALLGM